MTLCVYVCASMYARVICTCLCVYTHASMHARVYMTIFVYIASMAAIFSPTLLCLAKVLIVLFETLNACTHAAMIRVCIVVMLCSIVSNGAEQ